MLEWRSQAYRIWDKTKEPSTKCIYADSIYACAGLTQLLNG